MSSAATDCMAQFVAACAQHNIQKKEKEHDSLAERAEKRAAKRAAKRTGKHAHLRACELRGHAERGGKARQAAPSAVRHRTVQRESWICQHVPLDSSGSAGAVRRESVSYTNME